MKGSIPIRSCFLIVIGTTNVTGNVQRNWCRDRSRNRNRNQDFRLGEALLQWVTHTNWSYLFLRACLHSTRQATVGYKPYFERGRIRTHSPFLRRRCWSRQNSAIAPYIAIFRAILHTRGRRLDRLAASATERVCLASRLLGNRAGMGARRAGGGWRSGERGAGWSQVEWAAGMTDIIANSGRQGRHRC